MKTPELTEFQRRIRGIVQERNSQGGVTVSQIVTAMGLPTGGESGAKVTVALHVLKQLKLITYVDNNQKWRTSKFLKDQQPAAEEGLIFAALGKAGSDGLSCTELLKQCKPVSEARVRQLLRFMVDQKSVVPISRSSFRLNNQAPPEEAAFPLDKRIASAVLDALKNHDDSYDHVLDRPAMDIEVAMQSTFAKAGLPPTLWYPFSLAHHWPNDLRAWASDVLAGNTDEFTRSQDQ